MGVLRICTFIRSKDLFPSFLLNTDINRLGHNLIIVYFTMRIIQEQIS